MDMPQAFKLALEEVDHCNKCGFCLPACPTYRLTGNEVDSPRGRIALVEGALRDEIAADVGLETSLTFCLGCRACETACPSGVQYHRILEAGKLMLDGTRPGHRGMTFVPRTLLRLTKSSRRMARLARLGRRFAAWPMPEKIKQLLPMLEYRPQPVKVPVSPIHPLGTAAFFQGCVQEALFTDANQAAVALLTAVGFAVDIPARQICCGALAWHAGKGEEARRLARRNIAAFESSDEAPIVNTAGGCGAMLSEYGELLASDPEWADRAHRFSQRVKDWTGLLDQLDEPPKLVGTGERVVLQNSCHLVNVEGGGTLPASLAARVQGDTFVELAGQDQCCGSAGIYNIQHPDWAVRILDAKMIQVSAEAPDRVLVVNPGCQLQMTLGVGRSGVKVEVEHLARYLYRAYIRGQRETQSLDEI